MHEVVSENLVTGTRLKWLGRYLLLLLPDLNLVEFKAARFYQGFLDNSDECHCTVLCSG